MFNPNAFAIRLFVDVESTNKMTALHTRWSRMDFDFSNWLSRSLKWKIVIRSFSIWYGKYSSEALNDVCFEKADGPPLEKETKQILKRTKTKPHHSPLSESIAIPCCPQKAQQRKSPPKQAKPRPRIKPWPRKKMQYITRRKSRKKKRGNASFIFRWSSWPRS